ncbi:MerR family transcriptional regulator [Nonomuraea salmonea]|uniref:MerR family transcriptional regulator n=1 Tax=Nonomuraea salmonea TaxID=46181 RepID=A0ABV5NQ23_9ACTN
MDDNDLYPIGDVARRTGLSVSAIRYYSDAGIVAPTRLTEAGYRLYDVRAIARLELIRTLRELDAGLLDIRQLLAGETSLHDLLAAHLELVERQERDLRARRAVLRTLVRQRGTAAQAALMHRLVSMRDDERERLIDDFWSGVGGSLDLPSGIVDRLRELRPCLPDDPSAEQLEAWIELADLLQDEEFRAAVRAHLQDVYGTFPGSELAAPATWDFIHEEGAKIGDDLVTAYHQGLPPHDPRVEELVVRLAELAGSGSRQRLAATFLMVQDLPEDPEYDATYGRYVALVGRINGTPLPTYEQDPALFTWIATALDETAA